VAAGRTKLLLYYCRINETPGAPEDTRGDKEGRQRDRRAQRHHEDRRAQRGDRKRHQENRGEQRGDRRKPQSHNIQEPIFPVSDTEFKGGGDGRCCGDCIFGSNRPNLAITQAIP
jgi:hypothetical protein